MSPDRSLLGTIETALAVIVLLVATFLLTDLPQPYPTWPTVGGVPVNPELVVPGLLGLVALVGAVTDGFGFESVVVGVFGSLTLWLATMSLHALYTDTAGGAFAGGLYTLVVGSPLAVFALARSGARRFAPDGLLSAIGNRFGGI